MAVQFVTLTTQWIAVGASLHSSPRHHVGKVCSCCTPAVALLAVLGTSGMEFSWRQLCFPHPFFEWSKGMRELRPLTGSRPCGRGELYKDGHWVLLHTERVFWRGALESTWILRGESCGTCLPVWSKLFQLLRDRRTEVPSRSEFAWILRIAQASQPRSFPFHGCATERVRLARLGLSNFCMQWMQKGTNFSTAAHIKQQSLLLTCPAHFWRRSLFLRVVHIYHAH